MPESGQRVRREGRLILHYVPVKGRCLVNDLIPDELEHSQLVIEGEEPIVNILASVGYHKS